jgi:predicted RND superfamily exporter protein
MIQRLLTFPARRPIVALCMAAAVIAFAAVGITRIRADSSLATMFPRDNPAAGAMISVLDRFPAAAELIVLASVPDDARSADGASLTPEQSAERVRAFGRRFADRLAADPAAKPLAGPVIFKADESAYERYAREVVGPSGLFYLDDAAFAQARQRLTRDGMRQAIDGTLARLAQGGPTASAMKLLARDPLSLRDFVLSKMTPRRPLNTYADGAEFISPDGRMVLIRVAGTRPASDLAYCEQFMRLATAHAAAANTDQLTLHYTGAYAATDFSHQTIRQDSIISIITTCVLLQVLFFIFYRRAIRQFLLEIVPVAIGVFVGFGLYGWFRGTVSPVSAVIGGILAGMAVDYSVFYLASYFRHMQNGCTPMEAVRRTASGTVGAMFAAWFTSVIGFVAVAWSSVPTLRDFALLGALGLAGAFAAVVLGLPAVMTLYDTRRLARSDTPADRALPFRFRVEGVLSAVDRKRRWLLAATVAVAVASAAAALSRPGGLLPLEQDLHVMHPQPNPALAAQKELARRFGADPAGGLIVHLHADSPDRLVSLAHEVDRRLAAPAVRSAGVVGSLGIAAALPDPAVVARRRNAVSPEEVRQILSDFAAEMEARDFTPAAIEPYQAFLKSALTRQDAPGLADLLRHPEVAGPVLPKQAAGAAVPAEAVTMLLLNRTTDRRDDRDAVVAAARTALTGLDGATLTGLPVISHDTEEAVRHDLPLLLGTALVIVVAFLGAYYRSVVDTILALTPTVFSLIVLAAVARWTHQQLNLVNLVALPLLIGIDVDYGIYLVSLARQRTDEAGRPMPPLLVRVAASAQAVIVCATASALGFGSLMTVSVPAVRSLGFAVAVGVLSCVVGTFALLLPLLIWRERKTTPPQAGE